MCWKNRSTADELRRNGLEQARQFSWQRTAESLGDLQASVGDLTSRI
jgi:hypothetical protein